MVIFFGNGGIREYFFRKHLLSYFDIKKKVLSKDFLTMYLCVELDLTELTAKSLRVLGKPSKNLENKYIIGNSFSNI